jgi:hypothetical protein
VQTAERIDAALEFLAVFLLLGYQVRGINLPNFFGVVGWQVSPNQGRNFGAVRGTLDKFSTFAR